MVSSARGQKNILESLTMKLINILLLATVVLAFGLKTVDAAPEAEVLKFWNVSNEQSEEVVSHAKWQSLLDVYLDSETSSGVNLFDYAAVGKSDKKKLKAYLDELQQIDPRGLNKNEQFSYWVNLYNALTVDVILQEYPVESIKDIRFLTSLFGPWDKNFVKIQKQKLSLNDIEHRILRPIWQDPRIHFAVNCASIGCPNLQSQAFTSENNEVLLEKSAKEFINHPRGVELKSENLSLSSIFDWYGGDFGEDQAEILEYLSSYYVGPGAEQLEAATKIEFQYDWQLNQAVK